MLKEFEMSKERIAPRFSVEFATLNVGKEEFQWNWTFSGILNF